MKLKDLKTAYNVLCELDYPVPTELLLHLSTIIRDTETRTTERRIARMTEEQLIRMESKQKRTLVIYTADGRLIQKRTSELTFRAAIREIQPERIADMGLRLGRRPVIHYDETQLRRRISGYYYLCPGYFVIAKSTAAEKLRILQQIDQKLQLDWDVIVR